MKIMIIDDERLAMDLFEHEIREVPGVEILGKFSNPAKALDFLREVKVDLAVLDIQMPGMNGIELGKRMIEVQPGLMLFYITGFDFETYIKDVAGLRAIAYLLKPYRKGEVVYAMESAKRLCEKKRVFAKTFGHFDLFVNGEPIMFRSEKAKELLAILIDREGGTVNSEQIISILWEDRPNDEGTQNLCSKICRTLKKELKQNGVEDLLISARGVHRINAELLECDLYQYLKGDMTYNYLGEYMMNYSWGEYRMAALDKIKG